MPSRIEDYAVIGNCETLALIGRDGSIDSLCLPRFDSPARFAALLGEPKHGRWLIAPATDDARVTRRYLGDTLVLETVFRTANGAACLIDFMARREGACDVVRLVRGLQGDVAMRMELIARFDYGAIVPWVSRQEDGRLRFVAGPDRLLLDTNVGTRGEDFRTLAEFTVSAGQETSFVLNWSPSFASAPPALRAADALGQVQAFWSNWVTAHDQGRRLRLGNRAGQREGRQVRGAGFDRRTAAESPTRQDPDPEARLPGRRHGDGGEFELDLRRRGGARHDAGERGRKARRKTARPHRRPFDTRSRAEQVPDRADRRAEKAVRQDRLE